MHFLDRQSLAKRRTVWFLVIYLLTVTGVVYLSYSLLQALFLLQGNTIEPPRYIVLYLICSPFDFRGHENYALLATIGVVVAAIMTSSILVTTWRLRDGGRAIAKVFNAERVVPHKSIQAERQLYHVVEEMAIASGVRVPGVYILRGEQSINAFSAGWGPKDAVIVVTQGMLDQLTRDELEAVVAHEFSHILYGDTALNFRLMGLLVGSNVLIFFSWGACSFVAGTVMILIYAAGHAGRAAGAVMGLNNLVEIVGLSRIHFFLSLIAGLSVIAFANFLFNVILKYAVCRQREYLADAAAVQWTRLPEALISTLKKIAGCNVGSRIFHSQAGRIAHMTFASVQLNQPWWLDTHPPLDSRIKSIESRKEFWPEQENEKSKPKQPVQMEQQIHLAKDWAMTGTTKQIPLALASISDLMREIPERVTGWALDPNTVVPLVYALMLDHNPEIREKQRSVIAGTNVGECLKRVDEMLAITDPICERLRPVLAEMAFPALRHLTPEHYRVFRKTLNTLILADDRIDLFEYTFNALLMRDLDLHFKLAKEVSTKYFSCLAVFAPFVTVLSAVAYAGDRGDGKVLISYEEGLSIFEHRAPILPSKQCNFKAVNAALQELAASSPAVRKRIIRALTACILADQFVTARERELIRAISAMLGVPMPAFA